MEGTVVLFIIYWIAVGILFLVGLVKIIIALVNDQPVKPGLMLIIAAIIMLVIGVGACAAIMSGISVR